jgi:hypothetical protein
MKNLIPHSPLIPAVLSLMFLLGADTDLCPDPATRYLYLDHWAYRYIDFLQERGFMRDLNRSVRPYQRGDVARSVWNHLNRTTSIGDLEKEWLKLLEKEFEEDLRLLSGSKRNDPVYYVRGVAREDADAMGDDRDADYFLSGEVLFRLPSLVFSSRISIDQSLFDHPNYLGRDDISIAGRVEDSYLLTRFKAISLFFGRTERTWSPFPDMSLVLSGNPFSYDHLFLRIGGERLGLQSLFARLSDLPSGALGVDGQQRYLSAHRLDFRLGSWLQMGLFESALYGGNGKGLDLALLNPFAPYFIIENSTTRQMNSFVGFDLFFMPRQDITLSMQLLIDDVKLSLFGTPILHGDEVEPNEFGFAIGGTYSDPLGIPNTLIRARYHKVTNYTYNAVDSLEQYLHGGINLGSGKGNDFDELTFGADYFFEKGWILSGSVNYLRLGEGRVTDPFPIEFTTDDLPFPSGVVEKRVELEAELFYQPSAVWFIGGTLGFEDVTNKGHVGGEDDLEIKGSVRVQFSWWDWFS